MHRVLAERCESKFSSEDDRKELLGHLNTYSEIFGGTGFCMSAKGDMLSQWRAYANNGGGVSIGFDDAYLKSLSTSVATKREINLTLKKVEYNPEQQARLVDEVLDELKVPIEKGAFTPTLVMLLKKIPAEQQKEAFEELYMKSLSILPLLFTLKNPAFEEEAEWRMLSHIVDGVNSMRSKGFQYRGCSDRIIPYNEIELSDIGMDSIKEIVLGPRNITPIKTVQRCLKSLNFPNVTVRPSAASYR